MAFWKIISRMQSACRILCLSCLNCGAFNIPATPVVMPLASLRSTTMHLSPYPILMASVDVPLDEAFQDSVSFTDGPIRTILIVFGIFVVLAAGLKTMMGQMDNAIEQVIRDFEATMRAYYSKRWRAIETNDLQGLEGYERDIKLLQVMEQMQKDESEFMTEVAHRGAPPKELDTTIVDTTAESLPDKE